MSKTEQDKTTNLALRWGVFSAILTSLCCIGPLVLVFLGIGSASTALSIGYQKPYFLVVGVIILSYGFFRLYRKSRTNQCLNRRQQFLIFGGSFIVAVLLYYLLTFVIVPLLAPLVYQFRYGG